MLNRKLKQLREVQARRANGEKGFTLIELLVVIIIIGILASIAIPIFMNQQKTARDAATTSDVKNAATNIQTALVKHPDAVFFAVTDDNIQHVNDTNFPEGAAFNDRWSIGSNGIQQFEKNGKITLWVGDTKASSVGYEITVSNDTFIGVEPVKDGSNNPIPGSFIVKGYNPNGKSYVQSSPLIYNSSQGGIR